MKQSSSYSKESNNSSKQDTYTKKESSISSKYGNYSTKEESNSCSIVRNIDMNKLADSMNGYVINKMPLTSNMKKNLDKLGIKYGK